MSRRLAVAAVMLLVLEALVVAFLGKGLRASKTVAAHRVKAKPEAKEMVTDHLVRATTMMARAISNLEVSPMAVARPAPTKVQETTMALMGASLATKVVAPHLREQTMTDLGLDNLGTVKAVLATEAKAATEMPLGIRVAREGNLAQDPRAPVRLAQATIPEANLARLEMVLVATAKTAQEGLAQTAATLMEPTAPVEAVAQVRTIQMETEMLMGATPLEAMVAMVAVATELPTMGTNLDKEGLVRTALAPKELGPATATASLATMEDRVVPLLEGAVQGATLAGAEALMTALLDLGLVPGQDLALEMALLRIRVEEFQAGALPDLIREVATRLLIRVGEFRAPVLLMGALPEMALLEMDQEMTIRTRAGEFRAAALRAMTLEGIHPPATVHRATDLEAHHHQELDPTLEAVAQEEQRTPTEVARVVDRMAAQMAARMVVPTEAQAEVQAAPTAAPTAVPTVARAETQMAARAEVRMVVRMAVPTVVPTEALGADQTLAALGLEMETPAATVQGMDQTTGEEQLFLAPMIPNVCLEVAWMATAAQFGCRVSADVKESRAATRRSAMMEAAAF